VIALARDFRRYYRLGFSARQAFDVACTLHRVRRALERSGYRR
jgi:hypothetical protein